MDLDHKYIRDIPDFPKPGILFKDITPLLAEPQALSVRHRPAWPSTIAAAPRRCRGRRRGARLPVRRAAGPALQKPLIPLRKPGKLPYHTHTLKYDLEYGSAELHVHIDGIAPGARVLLVDDLLATGGTMEAGCQLIEKAGGKVARLRLPGGTGVPRRARQAASRTRCSA